MILVRESSLVCWIGDVCVGCWNVGFCFQHYHWPAVCCWSSLNWHLAPFPLSLNKAW